MANTNFAGTNLYNGNIKRMITSLRDTRAELLPTKVNLYHYDQLNRIFKMPTYRGPESNGSFNSLPDYYSEFAYDRNGNLTSLDADAPWSDGSNPESIEEMDRFKYHYAPLTNKLNYITDQTPDASFDVDVDNQHSNNYRYNEVGELIGDYAGDIRYIDWRVDGKVKSILKGSGMAINFFYDGLGNRVAKQVTQSRERGTSTTHYTRDAQGNVMGVYNIHLDPNGERPEYLLSEHHIYGSSRLGIQNYFNNDGNSDFIRLVGDKRYELSNHLGNVLSVITDRKLVPNEAKLLYSETFQKATAWIPDNAILLNSSGQLDITCSALDAGIKKQLAFNASTPVIFQMSVTKGTGFPAAVPLVFSVRDMSNHVVWSTIVDDSGIVSGTWTPAVSANYWIKVSVGVAAPFPLLFSIDNFYAYMLPSPPDDFSGLYLPDVVAFNDYFPFGMLVPNRHKSAPDYRYGFQGQEKDDEVKGEGNSINFTYRMHDPRVGRFFVMDPLTKKYAHNSPYAFSENRVIDGVELEGLEVEIIISDIPNGETQLRIIGSEDLEGILPRTLTVPTYALTLYDKATKTTTVYSVTRDAIYIDGKDKPDDKGNYNIKNIPFEPKNKDDNNYTGEERESFGSTELPAIRLRKKGSIKLPAEPVSSPWRQNPETASGINIHVGGEYTTSKTPPGYVNTTGSEGCFTIIGGNAGITNLQKDIDERQEKLKESGMSDIIEIQIIKREDYEKTFSVPTITNEEKK